MTRACASLTDSRAVRLHGREIVLRAHREAFAAEVVIGVALHNHATTLRECLASVAAQRGVPLPMAVLLLDDNSTDDWQAAVEGGIPHLNLAIAQAACGSAASARNCLLDLVDEAFPQARWVARLDADDRFASPDSLATAVQLASSTEAVFVLGGNRLRVAGNYLERTNPATPDLLRRDYVLARLAGMARGEPEAELPSCNLLLATRTGLRYPALPSAEDHCLVASLLLCHSKEGAILSEPLYADYSLAGAVTSSNHEQERYLPARRLLLEAGMAWAGEGTVLGVGWEGVVIQKDGEVRKHFRDGVLDDEHVEWLQRALRDVMPHLPEPVWSRTGGAWTLCYPWFPTEAVLGFALDELREFFVFCLRENLVCANVNHANVRRHPGGGLVYVDVGRDVLPMNVDYFRDACARGFVLAELEWTDDELRRRSLELRDEKVLRRLPGFAEFYSSILHDHARRQWAGAAIPRWPVEAGIEPRVTLLIKASAMDAAMLAVQVRHIVGQLERPRRFAERLLAIDPFRGPFLRQHCSGDWQSLMEAAEALRAAGFLDRVVIAPDEPTNVKAIHTRWFALPCEHSHSVTGVPVAPQLWAFEQVRTRYVLQCDVDVLIGRRDLSHDYLADMLDAAATPDALGVGFNIPHAPDAAARPYDAPPGGFVPEVRCGLLDLGRVRACLPLPNSLVEGRLELTWYRSLQQQQQASGLRFLRGGDPRTFYVHPSNPWKRDAEGLDRMRDLTAQGRVPGGQWEQWDVAGTCADWRYERRHESIVFVVKGRNTAPAKVERCLCSLAMQNDQNFGLVLVDDASENGNAPVLPHLLKPFAGRCTLVCRNRRHGYMPNTLLAVCDLMSSPAALAVVLDLDDALLHRSVVTRLKQATAAGADVVLAAMFRPDKPLKLYHPDFVATRQKWGGEVWIHLRAFRKRLLDSLPDEDLQLDGKRIEDCEDYAIMIPLVEMAERAVYLPEYLYLHERSKPTTPELRSFRDEIIRRVLAKPSRRTVAGKPKPEANP